MSAGSDCIGLVQANHDTPFGTTLNANPPPFPLLLPLLFFRLPFRLRTPTSTNLISPPSSSPSSSPHPHHPLYHITIIISPFSSFSFSLSPGALKPGSSSCSSKPTARQAAAVRSFPFPLLIISDICSLLLDAPSQTLTPLLFWPQSTH